MKPQLSPTKKLPTFQGWQRTFFSVRARLLVWYFLLTTCTALISIPATRQIYCGNLKTKAEASLVQEINRFKLLENQQPSTNTAALFDQFLSNYAPTPNEYIITLLNNRLYKASPSLPHQLLQRHPNLMQEWSQLTEFRTRQISNYTERIIYVAQPVSLGNVDRGTIVAIKDSSVDYEAGTSAILLVIQVTIVVLVFFFLIAWFTAGRVLYPLRLLTKTAQSITLGSCVKEDYAYIWVRDTGEGIAPEDQERIFERFVRATNRDRSQFEGHGLGLAIVQAIVNAHGGWVELSSRLGQGSTFTIVMPLDSHLSPADDEPNSHRRRQPPHYRVLGNRIASARVHNDNSQ